MSAAKGASGGSSALRAHALKMKARYGAEKVSNASPRVIVPTGSIAVDRALRVGGWQRGRIYEILGQKDSGKSTLMIASMIQFLKMFPDRGVCYINLENTFDEDRATAMGLDCSEAALESGRWAPRNPSTSEEVSDMARDDCSSGVYSVIVVDSVGAMESKRVLEKEAEKDTVGRNAGIITKLTKALAWHAKEQQCTILLVNQPRANMSGFGGDISAGPKAMQHSTTAKIEMSRRGSEEDVRKVKLPGDEDAVIVSQRHVARVTRMKNGVDGLSAQFFINKTATEEYGPPGIDTADEYLTYGHHAGAVKVGGAWYTFPDGHRANGRVAAARYLRENPAAVEAVRSAMTFEEPVPELEGVS